MRPPRDAIAGFLAPLFYEADLSLPGADHPQVEAYLEDAAALLLTHQLFPPAFSGAVLTPYLNYRSSWSRPVCIVNPLDRFESRVRAIAGVLGYVSSLEERQFSITDFFFQKHRESKKGVLEALDRPIFVLFEISCNEADAVHNAAVHIKQVALGTHDSPTQSIVKLRLTGPRKPWEDWFRSNGSEDKLNESLKTLGDSLHQSDRCRGVRSIRTLQESFQAPSEFPAWIASLGKEAKLTIGQVTPLLHPLLEASKDELAETVVQLLAGHSSYGKIYALPIELRLGKALRGQLLVWVFFDRCADLDDSGFAEVEDWLLRVTKPAARRIAHEIAVADLHEGWRTQSLLSAGSAIMVESYAHNIGAHALEGLQRFVERDWEAVKEAICSTETPLWVRGKVLANLPELAAQGEDRSTIRPNLQSMLRTHSQLSDYLSYLQGKSAFWNAVSRGGVLFGGQIRSAWDLVDGFLRNNLLLGTLATSEGYKGVQMHIHLSDELRTFTSNILDDERFRLGEESIGNEKAQLKAFRRRMEQAQNKAGHVETTQDPTQRKCSNDPQTAPEQAAEKLDAIKLFFPEGVVGLQAVYTIWENVLRNAKHCKKPRESTDKEERTDFSLVPLHVKFEDSKDERLVSVTVWLDLAPDDPDELAKRVDEMQRWGGIMLEGGLPNMGGTSQNILCAGIARALPFGETEQRQRHSDSAGRVIRFNTVGSNERLRLHFSFDIWKGADLKRWENGRSEKTDESSDREPLGRYPIVLVRAQDHKVFLSESSAIRHFVRDSQMPFPEAYRSWVQEAILKHGGRSIEVYLDKNNAYHLFSEKDWCLGSDSDDTVPCGSRFLLYHRGTPNDDLRKGIALRYRHQGALDRDLRLNELDDCTWAALVEALSTQVLVVDDRLHARAETLSAQAGEDQTVKLRRLGATFLSEKVEPSGLLDHPAHFLIAHLSWVERVTGERDRKAVERLLTAYEEKVKDYLFVLLTTGRGRGWHQGLSPEHKGRVRFVPIENLERCFTEGARLEPYCPALGIKYGLIKAILGS